MKFKLSILSFLLIVLFFSCKKDDEVIDASRGKEYIPMEVGKYIVYDVEKITYNGSIFTTILCDTSPDGYSVDFQPEYADTLYYQIKEEVYETYLDDEGEKVYVIYRYEKYQWMDHFNFAPDSVWTGRFKINQFIKTEDNKPYVKMSFPVSKKSKWDGNMYNSINEFDGDKISEIYEYEEIGFPNTYTGFTDRKKGITSTLNFDNTVTVLQKDEGENVVGRVKKYEVFAENVGMVFKHEHVWNWCQNPPETTSSCSTCGLKEIIDTGYELNMTVIEHN